MTLDRLQREGYSKDNAIWLIGCVVMSQLLGIVCDEEPYDETLYVQTLPRKLVTAPRCVAAALAAAEAAVYVWVSTFTEGKPRCPARSTRA